MGQRSGECVLELDPTLIVITDRGILARASGMPLADAARAAAAGGATIVQLREKEAPAREILRLADEVGAALEGTGCAFMVNDRVDIALACGAEGVHLGQEDLPLSRMKAISGNRLRFGVSAGKQGWAERASAEGADYIGVGPIFATGTKENARPPIGPEGLARVAAAVPAVPAVAIGGLTDDNLASAFAAGARGVAVINAVMGASDPEAATRKIRLRIEEARG